MVETQVVGTYVTCVDPVTEMPDCHSELCSVSRML